MSWTAELIDQLTQLWSEGHSASVIGKKLSVSKNAVVGKAHRLGLPARPSPIRKEARPQPVRRPPAPLPQPKPLLLEPAPSGPRREFMPSGFKPGPSPRQSSCAWPLGDPTDSGFRFCGEATVSGKPYCSAHCAVAYVSKGRDKEIEAA
jgi:GcrA cell cycle regulator